jgi:hypothetical protein
MTLAPTRRNDQIRKALRALAPEIPLADADDVQARAARITKSGVAPASAVWLAIVAHVRHRYTDYDLLLGEGYDRDAARHFVVDATEEKLGLWGCRRRIDTEAEDE